MPQFPIWVLAILIFLTFQVANSEDYFVKHSLVRFMDKLTAGNNVQRDQNWGWNLASDPCNDKWAGVECNSQMQNVRKVVLNKLNFSGTLDTGLLCMAKSLVYLSLEDNNLSGEIQGDIVNCKRLTHVYLSGNHLSGKLPDSLSRLNNLKRLEIYNNSFSGELPDLARISGLLTFRAQNNYLSGPIPQFDFTNLLSLDVSNNNFSGPIPDVHGNIPASSFAGNPGLCGDPLPNACPPSPPPKKSNKLSLDRFLIYSGYAILGVAILAFIAYKLVKRKKPKDQNDVREQQKVEKNENSNPKKKNISYPSGEVKESPDRSEYSITSVESGMVSSSLVLLTNSAVKELKFEELLRAPAELLGRGKHGTVYKVILGNRMTLAVRRLRGWDIPKEDFKGRMQRMDRVRHPNVLPVMAFYCSKQEKLLVYEYQQKGSLFNLLHGTQYGQAFEWGSRLRIAATIANALAHMHEKLGEDGIAHGNLKSSNILFNNNMDPCISEYGLMVVENHNQPYLAQSNSFSFNITSSESESTANSFKVDVYGFGVILLELLTGKLVQNNGFHLARWVHSVVKEEWTYEVFDRALVSEGASEERMVNMLQVALKCINPNPDARPIMNQVASMLNSIKEEEERSLSFDP
ncbi:Leucine-rich repeat [Dillenia turbinata]|uniref:Leucine-rich repeat n=1 Tax=Dillenia turbinata TaxID=194707 RepID=A0AAN8Z179_9MAGN